jgi:hypothetical protein
VRMRCLVEIAEGANERRDTIHEFNIALQIACNLVEPAGQCLEIARQVRL